MEIKQVFDNKKEYIDLLLLADEQEDMVDRYLDRGEMFVLEDDGVKAECVVTKEDEGVYELKNIAVVPEAHRKGYGRKLIAFLFEKYAGCETMYVGTGDCPSTISFYKSCGFEESHRVKNFFVDNYDHIIIEDGIQLVDMVYLKKKLPVAAS
ncbi:MAG: GNAT family N-acetyltransferase [bacterium]|nr:GNAT family N-acetyltransferase [bacterium]